MNQELIKEIAGVIKKYVKPYMLPEDYKFYIFKLSDLFEREDTHEIYVPKKRRFVSLTKKVFNPSQFKKGCGVE